MCKWALVLTMALAVAGCSKQEGVAPSGGEAAAIDTTALEQSFQSADPVAKSSVDKAVTALKAGDYAGALTQLKAAAQSASITPEQKRVLQDIIAQVQARISNSVTETLRYRSG